MDTDPREILQRIHEKLAKLTDNDIERERKIDEQNSIDVLFLMDITRSMVPYAHLVKGKVGDVMQSLLDLLNPASPFVAFVGYTDVDFPETQRFKVVDFTQETYQVVDCVNNIPLLPGADWAEDVIGGLQKTTTLSWRSRTRVVFHMFDAPPHGSRYHDLPGDRADNYKNGVPNEESLENLFEFYQTHGIDYYAIPLQTYLDKMMRVFGETYQEITQKPMGQFTIKEVTANFAKAVIRSVEMSLTGERVRYTDVELVDAASWSAEDSKIYDGDIYTQKSSSRPQKQKFQIMNKPFGSGSMRLSYFVKLLDGNGNPMENGKLYVAKKWKGSSGVPKTRCWQQYACHVETIAILDVIKQKLQDHENLPENLQCLPIRVLYFKDGKEANYFTLEEYIEGKYVKYNNNYNFVNSEFVKTHGIFQAIPHFSYIHSSGEKMVVDLQGVGNILTDPAVHSHEGDLRNFGRADLGKVGMRGFFTKHKCNEFCTALGIFGEVPDVNAMKQRYTTN